MIIRYLNLEIKNVFFLGLMISDEMNKERAFIELIKNLLKEEQ